MSKILYQWFIQSRHSWYHSIRYQRWYHFLVSRNGKNYDIVGKNYDIVGIKKIWLVKVPTNRCFLKKKKKSVFKDVNKYIFLWFCYFFFNLIFFIPKKCVQAHIFVVTRTPDFLDQQRHHTGIAWVTWKLTPQGADCRKKFLVDPSRVRFFWCQKLNFCTPLRLTDCAPTKHFYPSF